MYSFEYVIQSKFIYLRSEGSLASQKNEWKEQVGEMLPKEYQEMLSRVKKATKVLTSDPEPEVAPTPKEVIWTKNKTKLYRYISEQPTKH